METREPKPARPLGVTIFAAIAFVGGIFGLLGGVMVLSGSASEPLWLGYVVIVFAIFGFALGYGFFRGLPWAWMVGLVIYVLSLPLGIYEITLGGAGMIGGAVRVIIGLIVIYFLMQAPQKAFFGRK